MAKKNLKIWNNIRFFLLLVVTKIIMFCQVYNFYQALTRILFLPGFTNNIIFTRLLKLRDYFRIFEVGNVDWRNALQQVNVFWKEIEMSNSEILKRLNFSLLLNDLIEWLLKFDFKTKFWLKYFCYFPRCLKMTVMSFLLTGS